jgi:hypothetical protein
MSSYKEMDGRPYMWCIFCRNYVRADIPHQCVNTEVFKTQEMK